MPRNTELWTLAAVSGVFTLLLFLCMYALYTRVGVFLGVLPGIMVLCLCGRFTLAYLQRRPDW
jgi:hypothetical protein